MKIDDINSRIAPVEAAQSASRSVTPRQVATNGARAVGVLLSRTPLQKSFVLECPDYWPRLASGVWPHEVDVSVTEGRWRESEFKPGNSRHDWREVSGALADWVELFDGLAGEPKAALVLGALRDKTALKPNGWIAARTREKAYEDRPTSWFIADVDNLPGELDDAESVVRDCLAEHAPELEDAARVCAFSPSAGIKTGIRLRIVFELAEPRTLAQQKHFVEGINKRAARQVFDASIYRPGGLIFTAAPKLIARIGAPERTLELRRPTPHGAWHVPGTLASVPDVAVAAPRAQQPARGEVLSIVDRDALLADMRPGNFHGPILRLVCSLAWTLPNEQRDTALRGLMASVEARIRATSEAADIDRRVAEHLSWGWLTREWDAARQRKLDLAAAVLAPSALLTSGSVVVAEGVNNFGATAGSTSATAQAAFLPNDISMGAIRNRMADKAVEWRRRVKDGEQLHMLLGHPPGTGKSTALRAVLDVGTVANRRTRILVPNHKLAEQLAADLKEHAAKFEGGGTTLNYAEYVHHIKGRRQPGMCTDEVHRPLAERAELLGQSPRESVCGTCPSNGTCLWLNQKMPDYGVVIEAHGALVGRDSKAQWADYTIIDESIIGSLFQKGGNDHEAGRINLANVHRELAGKGRGWLGKPIWSMTDEHAALRNELFGALRRAAPALPSQLGELPNAVLAGMQAKATFSKFVREQKSRAIVTGNKLDHLESLESDIQYQLRQMLDKPLPCDAREIVSVVRESMNVVALIAAIKDSATRDRVFGVNLLWVKPDQRSSRDDATYYVNTLRCADISASISRGALWLDGTADELSWRAVISPNGGAVAAEIFTERPDANPYVRACHYVDKIGTKSSLTTRDDDLIVAQADADVATAEKIAASIEANKGGFAGIFDAEDDAANVRDAKSRAATARVAAHQTRVARRQNKLRSDSDIGLIQRFIKLQAAKHREVLFVAQKAVVLSLDEIGLPVNVRKEHFGALRGLNAYKHVPVAVVVGRPRAADSDLEMAAEALHAKNQNVTHIVRRSQGAAWREHHSDAYVSSIQRITAAAEVVQAVARVRSYDRTAETPCEVHVFGVYPPGLPAERRVWSDAATQWDTIAAANGFISSSLESNRRAYEGLIADDGRNQSGDKGLIAEWFIKALSASVVRPSNGLLGPFNVLSDKAALKPSEPYIESKGGTNEEFGSPYKRSEGLVENEDRTPYKRSAPLSEDGVNSPYKRSEPLSPNLIELPNFGKARVVKLAFGGGQRSRTEYAIVRAGLAKADIEALTSRPIAQWRELPRDQWPGAR